ncbi:cap-specific mRNA (nucleoside-2'-O-)-methyltransferase 1 [Lutzomyia longipalpis]|uniref:Cap-specific mRNA (nucleoside-2'-O-)-methyltransferase 1 n=1 Tax=Lutzomyia longipalpis TaxID=7200 RepID=A0A1B0C969_LUTLO|nr:cap-specific mRNA (nucleoside-2'-O-)-methyltransferase 1 [Lutzomyia longipalpis]
MASTQSYNPSTSEDDSIPEYPDCSFTGYSNGMERVQQEEDDRDEEPEQRRGQKRRRGQNEEDEPKVKKSTYSDISWRMMKKMGYQDNTGLGKHSQGRVDPVEASKQKGRRGLGAAPDPVDHSATRFDETEEVIQMPEIIDWLRSEMDDLDELDRSKLDEWCVHGTRKLTIDDETLFCDPEILKLVLEAKTVFDDMNDLEMRRACQRSNPFETIKNAVFLNRAAVKMANMDALLNFMFTNPVDEDGSSLVRDYELLYFADVCAGPGGFSEYVLWKRKWHAKGFGFTLRAENDFNLDNFLAGHPETFHPFYGIKEDGDVYNPENIESLMKLVMNETETGVHFMMADGGFSVKNQENIQEILSKRLYLCQCLAALSILREKGHFVVKLFDLFTPFSVGLIYLMYKCFRQIAIIKPNTSRPANSERYLVCKWMKPHTDTIRRHLLDICETMYNSSGNEDIRELVPYEILREDTRFFRYIYESNNRIGRNQITGLRKIAAYAQNKNLVETRQAEIREQCLREWHLPSTMRTAAKGQKTSHEEYGSELLRDTDKKFMTIPENLLTGQAKLEQIFGEMQEHWYFVALNTPENSQKNYRTFFLSKGRQDVVMLNAKGTWEHLPKGVLVEMSPKTLIYGEIVQEHKGEDRSQRTTFALHIIDGLFLDGEDIRKFPLLERNRLCHKFAQAVNKPTVPGCGETTVPIRCKKLIPFRDVGPFIDGLQYFGLKNMTQRKGYILPNTDERFYIPKALLFLCEIKSNLRMHMSTRLGEPYYYDTTQKHPFSQRELKDPHSILASFVTTFNFRQLWKWEQEHQIEPAPYNPNHHLDDGDGLLCRTHFELLTWKSDEKKRHCSNHH